MTMAYTAAFSLPRDDAMLRAVLGRPGDLNAVSETSHLDRAIAALDAAGVITLAESVADGSALYRRWLCLRPTDPAACGIWYNLGTRLHAAGDTVGAVQAFTQALALKPDLWSASLARGLALEASGQPQAALAAWRLALPPAAERVRLHNQIGRVLEQEGRLAEAVEELRASLLITPDQPDVQQHLIHNRQRLAEWPPLALDIPGIAEATALLHCGPLASLALTDDPQVQASVAADWIARKLPPQDHPLTAARFGHSRLRIGYLSSDFCRHAMAFLITEVLENHDRAQFSVYGYCASPEDGSAEQTRLRAAMDAYVPIGTLTDEQAARRIRSDEIDILIDLNGLTRGSRLGVLRWRPAPLQLTYLGFIGPVPLPELDGFLCDEITVPLHQEGDYRSRAFRIAGCFQANDGRMPTLPSVTRTTEGLPDTGFVFACAAHHYKITAEVFSAWCDIARAVEGSVLWLAQDTPEGAQALTRRWKGAGLDPSRLIFAPRVAPDKYRARLALADLFLDTFPYNAGTVASDALRMGLPLLTRTGRSFASRMAASLLTAVNQADCITATRAEYIDLAVRIASDPAYHARLRKHLKNGAWQQGLGDSRDFTRRLEATLIGAHSAQQEQRTSP